MIIERKHFEINQKCVIEKLLVETPFKYNAVFQNEACFLHIKNGESIIKSPTEIINTYAQESILLKCGNYFAHLIQQYNKGNCEVYAVHLHSDILKVLFKDEVPDFIKPTIQKTFAQRIEKQDVIIYFIESIDFYFKNPDLVNDDLLKLKLKELILLFLQTEDGGNILSLFSHLFTPREANLKEVIQAHLYSNISVNNLAVLTNQSLSAFKRNFEIHFNDTPANYLKDKKLSKSKDLLSSTDLTISQICYDVGFNDTSHFTKIFKDKYNVTPTVFRKKNK